MKTTILSAIFMASISFAACDSGSNKSTESSTNQIAASTEQFSCPMHHEVVGKKGDKCPKCGMELTEPVTAEETTHTHDSADGHQHSEDGHHHDEQAAETTTPKAASSTTVLSSFSIDEIVSGYLKLKNAFTKDDTKAAGSAGKALYTIFNKIDVNSIDAKSKKEYLDIVETAKEHAEHIGDNAGNIEHQREHFALLSKDMNDLLKLFPTKQKLYQDFCPMYDDGKGAYWVSELKEIKNPYRGAEMLTCGSLKKEY